MTIADHLHISRLDTAIDGQAETQLSAIFREDAIASVTLCYSNGPIVPPQKYAMDDARYMRANPVLRVPHIKRLFVQDSPTVRRQGVAARLLRECMSICREAGCKSLSLDVAVDNGPALALYEKFGALVAGEDTGEDGKTTLRMVIPLAENSVTPEFVKGVQLAQAALIAAREYVEKEGGEYKKNNTPLSLGTRFRVMKSALEEYFAE